MIQTRRNLVGAAALLAAAAAPASAQTGVQVTEPETAPVRCIAITSHADGVATLLPTHAAGEHTVFVTTKGPDGEMKTRVLTGADAEAHAVAHGIVIARAPGEAGSVTRVAVEGADGEVVQVRRAMIRARAAGDSVQVMRLEPTRAAGGTVTAVRARGDAETDTKFKVPRTRTHRFEATVGPLTAGEHGELRQLCAAKVKG